MMAVNLLIAAILWSLAPGVEAQRADKKGPARSATPVAPAVATEKEQGDLHKVRLEIDKLNLEIRKLESERRDMAIDAIPKRDAEVDKLRAEAREVQPWWGTLVGALLGFLAVALTGWIAWRQAMKARIGTFDMKIMEARLAGYGVMVAAADTLALYAPFRPITKEVCLLAVNRLKVAYYSLTGLLLTQESQRRYVCLTHALLRASRELRGPAKEAVVAGLWKEADLKELRSRIGLTKPWWRLKPWRFWSLRETRFKAEISAVDKYPFGVRAEPAADDYVVLQFAASRFRTALIADIGSRRRLEG
jgi:hypothetical protein